MNDYMKVRVAGQKAEVERLTEILRNSSKQWGNRRIFRVRRYDRGENRNMYHRTFGNARFVNYIKMKLPEEELS